jgi:transposase
VGFVEAGHSRNAAAAHFGVSVSFVVILMRNYRATGSFAPKPVGGRRHSKLDPHRTLLQARVAEKHAMLDTKGRLFAQIIRSRIFRFRPR